MHGLTFLAGEEGDVLLEQHLGEMVADSAHPPSFDVQLDIFVPERQLIYRLIASIGFGGERGRPLLDHDPCPHFFKIE